MNKKIAIIGAGNLGKAIGSGILKAGIVEPENLILSRRHLSQLDDFKEKGVFVTSDNAEAVNNAEIILLAVKPYKFETVIKEIKTSINSNHILVSMVTGLDIKEIKKMVDIPISIFRAMPNTAIAIQESMTCISSAIENDKNIELITHIFDQLGKTAVIDDELMDAATVLAASGIAFALRYIRAAMQGGIEIGFSSELAQLIASQTVKGASSLVLSSNLHPEGEIDKVTTPLGITITGLNHMEFNGFSSSIIKGVLGSYNKIKSI